MRVDLDADAVMEVFQNAPPDSHCNLTFYTHQVEFNIQPEERHFWSPFLNLIVRNLDNGRAELTGKYGPNTNVWTMFLGAYFAGSSVAAVSLLIGLIQSSLKQPTNAFTYSLAGAAFVVMVYIVGSIGKRIAHDQTEILHSYVERLFESHIVSLEDEFFPEENSGEGIG